MGERGKTKATMGDTDPNLVARQEKLTSVSASMSTIYKDMEEHTKSRRELHENRLVSIEQSITRLEKHFQGSIKTVRDGLKEASEMFDKRLRDIDKTLKLSSERRAHEVENAVARFGRTSSPSRRRWRSRRSSCCWSSKRRARLS